MMNKRELELYIHIPFCAKKCAYCDFLSFAAPERTYREYMDKLNGFVGRRTQYVKQLNNQRALFTQFQEAAANYTK